MFTLYRIALALERKLYQIGLKFTHKNVDFGAISVTEQSCASRASKVKRRTSNRFCATLCLSVNRSDLCGSE